MTAPRGQGRQLDVAESATVAESLAGRDESTAVAKSQSQLDPHNVKADTAETDEIVEDTQGVDVATRDGISAYRGRKDLFVATVKRMDAAAFCKTVTKI